MAKKLNTIDYKKFYLQKYKNEFVHCGFHKNTHLLTENIKL